MSINSAPRGASLSTQSWFWLIVCAGMVIRIVWAGFIPVEPVSDSSAYNTFAWNIVNHGVYGWNANEPGAYWPVGTSAVAALTYMVLGDSFLGIVVLNLIASFATMYFINRLGDIYFGRPYGLVATAIIAFWPNLILFTTILSSELYFIALVTAGWFFWERREGKVWVNLALCGLIWGLGSYMRPVILFLPAAVAIATATISRKFVQTGVRCIVVTLLIVLVVSPWTYRNYLVFGEPVLVSTNFGPNFWMGNNPESTGGYMELPEWVNGMSETERATALSAIAKGYIAENPIRFATDTVVKAVKLHSRETIGVAWNEAAIESKLGAIGPTLFKLVSTGYWYAVVALALAGAAVLFMQGGFFGLFHPAVGGWAYFTLLHAIIVVEDRYHMASTPFIAMLAALSLGKAGQHYCNRKRSAVGKAA
ncbi:ArnT family glycosyltransferase [Aureimonas fodinaquatilis]|uniref:ArnT family glycosyltransferase n=1 Tax=Aureimonas fodinaquatilis TaxID=2565783 RepID=UPI001AEDE90E|nr:glycosyltransferase family 39 protein [Aureimonas fodinaquatilis]